MTPRMASILDQLTPADYVKLSKRAVMVAGHQSEDLLQEVLLKALENQHKFRGESTVCTWVHGFIGNVAMNQHTVWNGRGERRGRRNLDAEFLYEHTRLRSTHGKRTGARKSKNT